MENNKIKRKPTVAVGRGYPGLEKQKLYLYSNVGKYLRTYESVVEFLKDYYPDDKGKRPLFISNRVNDRASFGYKKLDDDNFICNFRAGREYLRKSEIIATSIYCNNIKNSRKIECFNLLGEKIAEFLNTRVLENLTKIDKNLVFTSCNTDVDHATKNGLIFKYKTE